MSNNILFLKSNRKLSYDNVEPELKAIVSFRFKNLIKIERTKSGFSIGYKNNSILFEILLNFKSYNVLECVLNKNDDWFDWVQSVLLNDLSMVLDAVLVKDLSRNMGSLKPSKSTVTFRDFIYNKYSSLQPELQYRNITASLPSDLKECV